MIIMPEELKKPESLLDYYSNHNLDLYSFFVRPFEVIYYGYKFEKERGVKNESRRK